MDSQYSPGFSVKKLACDVFLLGKAFRMRLRKRYDVVHAVEESVFIAMLLRLFFRTPYVFDMDSSMPGQITEKIRFLSRWRHCSADAKEWPSVTHWRSCRCAMRLLNPQSAKDRRRSSSSAIFRSSIRASPIRPI